MAPEPAALLSSSIRGFPRLQTVRRRSLWGYLGPVWVAFIKARADTDRYRCTIFLNLILINYIYNLIIILARRRCGAAAGAAATWEQRRPARAPPAWPCCWAMRQLPRATRAQPHSAHGWGPTSPPAEATARGWLRRRGCPALPPLGGGRRLLPSSSRLSGPSSARFVAADIIIDH